MVAPQLNSSYFLWQIPDASFSNVDGTCKVTITIGGSSIEELYQPSASAIVTISDLSSLVADYVRPVNVEGGFYAGSSVVSNIAPSVRIEAEDKNGVASVEFTVMPARQRNADLYNSLFLQRWRSREVLIDEVFTVSYYNPARTLRLTLYYVYNGQEISRYIDFSGSGSSYNMMTRCFSASWIASEVGVSVSSIVRCTLQLFDGGGSSDIIYITFNHHGSHAFRQIFFDNFMFAPEAFAFRGLHTASPVLNSSYLQSGANLRRVDSENYTEYRTNSGFVDDSMFATLQDLATAERAAFVAYGAVVPMLVTGLENNWARPKTRPSSVTVVYRETSVYGTTVRNDIGSRRGLFDRPYSLTFD